LSGRNGVVQQRWGGSNERLQGEGYTTIFAVGLEKFTSTGLPLVPITLA
jgi:hypothetical protein